MDTLQRAVAQHDCAATPKGVHSSQHSPVAARALAKRPIGMTLDKYSLEFTRGEVGLGADVLNTGAARLRDVRFGGYPDHALERVYEQYSNETGVVCASVNGGRSASMSGHT